MTTDNTFNPIYGNTNKPFYYGLNPSEELRTFLEEYYPQSEVRHLTLDAAKAETRSCLLNTDSMYMPSIYPVTAFIS